jgi:hypothetical protein
LTKLIPAGNFLFTIQYRKSTQETSTIYIVNPGSKLPLHNTVQEI